MTVIIGVAAPDGLVLASDSRLTRTVGESHRIISHCARMVLAVGSFAIATSGFAFIADDTVAGVMDRFVAQQRDAPSREPGAFADAVGSFFDARFREWLSSESETGDVGEDGHALEFLVAGYESVGVGHLFQVAVPGPVIDGLLTTTDGGAAWRGQTDAIGRLLKGTDWGHPTLYDLPREALKKLAGLEYVHLFPTTVQDAVDYANFLVRTTIDMQRFSDGTLDYPGLVPGCGGAVQLDAVDRGSLTWVARPAVAEVAQA